MSKKIKAYSPSTLNGFWKNRIQKWMIKDIRKCIDNDVNFGSLTLICCYIDFLGSLQRPNSRNRERFYFFIEKYLKPFNQDYDFWKCKIYEDYRCPLVHEGTMKKGSTAITSINCKLSDRKNHLQKVNNYLFLDIEYFFNDFKKATQSLKRDLDKNNKSKKIAIKRLNNIGWLSIKK